MPTFRKQFPYSDGDSHQTFDARSFLPADRTPVEGAAAVDNLSRTDSEEEESRHGFSRELISKLVRTGIQNH